MAQARRTAIVPPWMAPSMMAPEIAHYAREDAQRTRSNSGLYDPTFDPSDRAEPPWAADEGFDPVSLGYPNADTYGRLVTREQGEPVDSYGLPLDASDPYLEMPDPNRVPWEPHPLERLPFEDATLAEIVSLYRQMDGASRGLLLGTARQQVPTASARREPSELFTIVREALLEPFIHEGLPSPYSPLCDALARQAEQQLAGGEVRYGQRWTLDQQGNVARLIQQQMRATYEASTGRLISSSLISHLALLGPRLVGVHVAGQRPTESRQDVIRLLVARELGQVAGTHIAASSQRQALFTAVTEDITWELGHMTPSSPWTLAQRDWAEQRVMVAALRTIERVTTMDTHVVRPPIDRLARAVVQAYFEQGIPTSAQPATPPNAYSAILDND